MPTLRIQHSVPSFEAWKRAFDSDPVDRKGGGVRSYQIHRCIPEPNLVMIDLQFETLSEAETFLGRLRGLWNGPGKAVMQNPEAWIVETVAQ
jgi:hypothetical protein